MGKSNVLRPWLGEYWSENSIVDAIQEVVDPGEVDVSSIRMNETLSPSVWDGDVIKEDVRKVLLLNAKRFIEFSDLDKVRFKDITLTGSMANYNYSEHSDLDVHILINFKDISTNIGFVGEFLKLKKQLWSDKLPIKVKDHDVELYFQDVNEPHHSTGVYSLLRNEWVVKPTRKIMNINTQLIQTKAAYLMNEIDDLKKNFSMNTFLQRYDQIKTKIKKYRQIGLEGVGEFSVENLVFKVLRNSGYLDKLTKMKNTYLTQELSLKEVTFN